MNRTLLIALFGVLCNSCFSQTITNRDWQVSITYGPSIPIGKFKNTDIEPFFREEDGFTFIDGFYKKDNGFAKVGYQISAKIKKSVSRRSGLSIDFGYSKNDLEKELFDNSLVEKGLAGRVNYVQEPYQVISIVPSISYSVYRKGSTNIAVTLGYGWSQMEYPFYRAELFPEDSGVFFGQVSKRDNVQASLLHLGVEFDYDLSDRFGIYISSNVRSGDFEYDSVVTQIPGGSRINERVDEVNLRVISINFGFSYSLNFKN